jgi:hypothetical protein
MTRRQINAVRENGSQIDTNGEIEMNLGQISSVYNSRDFTKRLISAVNIATAYRDDIDAQNGERKLSSTSHRILLHLVVSRCIAASHHLVALFHCIADGGGVDDKEESEPAFLES